MAQGAGTEPHIWLFAQWGACVRLSPAPPTCVPSLAVSVK